jgi:hypothetical protein
MLASNDSAEVPSHLRHSIAGESLEHLPEMERVRRSDLSKRLLFI